MRFEARGNRPVGIKEELVRVAVAVWFTTRQQQAHPQLAFWLYSSPLALRLELHHP